MLTISRTLAWFSVGLLGVGIVYSSVVSAGDDDLGVWTAHPYLSSSSGTDRLSESLREAIRKLPAKPDRPDVFAEWCNAQLYLRKARFYHDQRDHLTFAWEGMARELNRFEEALIRLKGNGPIEPPAGYREEGYWADNDGSFQPFVRFIPTGKPRQLKRPLLVFLHGYSPALNLINWAWIPFSMVAFAEQDDWLVVAPFGRGNTDYQGIGEQDVLRAIEEMVARHGADTNRIVLTGHSMGAMGVWSIGAHYPDRFAGLLPVSGRGDFYFWKRRPATQWPRWQQLLIDAEFGGSLIENLARIPIYSVHSRDDDLVPVEEARHMAEKVRAVNSTMIYRELPEGGHLIFEKTLADPEVRQWLRTLTSAAPPPLHYRTWSARYARSGNPLPDGLPKGPIKAAFLDPFAFILAGNPPSSNTLERFRKAVQDWALFAQAMPRLGRETSGDPPSEYRDWNLFLFGEPEESSWIRQVLADSPVRIENDSFVVGERRFPRAGNGLYVLRPNPWNSNRVVVVQSGLHWGEQIPANHKYDFLPDFIVYSSETEFEGLNTALAAGFFDPQWRIPP